MESIDALKTFSADRLTLDELLMLRATARLLKSEYEVQAIPLPEWLDDAERRITREVYLRRQDELEKRLREARQSRATIATPDEKRTRLDEEITRLEALITGPKLYNLGTGTLVPGEILRRLVEQAHGQRPADVTGGACGDDPERIRDCQ